MKYIIEENIKKLKLLLEHYKKPLYTHQNSDTEDADKLWNASLFFANVFLESNYSGFDISENVLNEFTENFEKQNKETINLKGLFSNFWLRKIFDNIYVPSIIRKTTRDYEDKKDKYNELLFVRHIKTELGIDETTSDELNELIKSFESDHKISLDKNWLFKSQYFKAKKDNSVLKINGVDYFTKLLDNWTTFKYINELLKYKQSKYDSNISIKKLAFNKIYKKHKVLYPKTPTLDGLIENEAIKASPQGYLIHIRSGNPNFIFDLAGPIKAIIW